MEIMEMDQNMFDAVIMDVYSDIFENQAYAARKIEILEEENENLLDEYNMYALINTIRGYDYSQELSEIHNRIEDNDYELEYLYELEKYGYDVA